MKNSERHNTKTECLYFGINRKKCIRKKISLVASLPDLGKKHAAFPEEMENIPPPTPSSPSPSPLPPRDRSNTTLKLSVIK